MDYAERWISAEGSVPMVDCVVEKPADVAQIISTIVGKVVTWRSADIWALLAKPPGAGDGQLTDTVKCCLCVASKNSGSLSAITGKNTWLQYLSALEVMRTSLNTVFILHNTTSTIRLAKRWALSNIRVSGVIHRNNFVEQSTPFCRLFLLNCHQSGQ